MGLGSKWMISCPEYDAVILQNPGPSASRRVPQTTNKIDINVKYNTITTNMEIEIQIK